MGADQSNTSKKKDDEKYEKMMKIALEQQKNIYEKQYEELQKQIVTKGIETNEIQIGRNVPQQCRLVTNTQQNHAPLYPDLQHINSQPSTSTQHHQGYPSNISVPVSWQTIDQRYNIPAPFTIPNPNICQPSAPIDPEVSEPAQQTDKPKIKLYKCPSCRKKCFKTNMYQCQNGHSSCNQCKIKDVKCGTCKSVLTDIRNIELEHILSKIQLDNKVHHEKVPCPYKSDGCKLFIKSSNLSNHLIQCNFREMECPLAALNIKCNWRGKINHIRAHFLERHPETLGAEVGKEMVFDVKNIHLVYHVAVENFNFLLHVKMDNNLEALFMTVQIIGSAKQKTLWTHEFHVYNKREPRRKYLYSARCFSVTPFSEMIKDSNCAVLPLRYAQTFYNDRKIFYKFNIKKEEYPSRRLPETNPLRSET